MTDITKLAQLRDRTVDYPHYLVECDCGKIYPSNELNGGEPMGDTGDYSDCYCPHCGEDEEHFAECTDPETAWKAQQDKIDELVGALEKAKGMETYWKAQCRGITDHCEELQARIAELESRTVKLPKRFCPEEYEGSLLWSETEVWNQAISACNGALRTAGIKVEDE